MQIIMDEGMKNFLKRLAVAQTKSVSELVRAAVAKVYVGSDFIDFTKIPAFGAWKDIKKSDRQLLKEMGGNWKNFPLK